MVGCGGEHTHQPHQEDSTEQVSANEDNSGHEAQSHAHFACPMDCEDGKVYEEAGTCPVCKMDLTEVAQASETESEVSHNHDHTFACPMHSEITGHDGDKCSICGMDLKAIEK